MTEGPNLQWEKQIKSIKAKQIPPGEKGRADKYTGTHSLER